MPVVGVESLRRTSTTSDHSLTIVEPQQQQTARGDVGTGTPSSMLRWRAGLRKTGWGAMLLCALAFLRTVQLSGDSAPESSPAANAGLVFFADSQVGVGEAQGGGGRNPSVVGNPRVRRSLQGLEDGDFGLEELRESQPLFLSVKTTQKYHLSRVRTILDTWFNLAPYETFFFSDAKPGDILNETHLNQWIVTGCPAKHNRQALCCKLGAEYEYFLTTGHSWWCHFDDDNYVNVPLLRNLLDKHDPHKDWYLGRPSTQDAITIQERKGGTVNPVSFWFATGGAGFCVSKSLANKMRPYAANGKFPELGEKIRLPDDVSLGYLIEHLLGVPLTKVESFHSHLENMQNIPPAALRHQVTLSYGSYNGRDNTIRVVGGKDAVAGGHQVAAVPHFSTEADPSRFRTLHCQLYPKAKLCSSPSSNSIVI